MTENFHARKNQAVFFFFDNLYAYDTDTSYLNAKGILIEIIKMSGHKHNSSAMTQNQGNTLGDRSCVRQSKLYRM